MKILLLLACAACSFAQQTFSGAAAVDEQINRAVSTGLISSSDKRVHFGLGPEREVRSIEIHWPSGSVQTLGPMVGDRIFHIEEPRQSP